ncbi:MAG: DNA polymerase Y family protein [Planctomycetales bacterium]|nr:DNA polymerase Y family protein [Planctomycetales bacterium]
MQRLRSERPEFDGRPLIVSTTRGGRGRRVLCCCDEAAARGVATGMTLADAAVLFPRQASGRGRSPVCIESHDPLADREALGRLADWCQRFSPLVGIEQAELADSLLLNVTGLAHLFDGEAGLAAKVVRAFAQRHFEVRVAVAHTVGAAWAVAHYGFEHIDGFEHIGLAQREGRARGERPDAVTARYLVLTADDEQLLGSLPLAALRLSPVVIEPLVRLGIERIEQLGALPRTGVFERLGEEVNRRLDQFSGQRDEPIVAHDAEPRFYRSWSFEPPTTHTEAIGRVLAGLIEPLLELLTRQNRGAVGLACRFFCEGGQRLDVEPRFFQPTTTARDVHELVLLELDGRRFPAAVSQLVVTVTESAPLEWRQTEFFAAGAERHPLQLTRLVNRLSSRLGREQVVRPLLHGEAQPERAFRDVPLISNEQRRERVAMLTTALPFERPLRLFQPPVAIEVIAAAPDGPPARLHYLQQTYDVGRYWGPERIQTGWWRGRSVERDYYRVEARTGSRFWLFRRLGDGRWFLHGEFA